MNTHISEYPFEDTIRSLFFSLSPEKSNLYWEDLCNSINNYLTTKCEDYIWHRDNLKLYVPKINEYDLPHLLSVTCFGDNIEDEWFVVYLILEITKLYKDLVIQIVDNDGDFLLIEAADYLPSWANPETTMNRVFIHDKYVYLIPPELASLNNKLNVTTAIETLKKNIGQCRVSQEIMGAITKRIGNYPDKIKESFHRAVVKLPLDVATVLSLKTALIAPLVNAYCSHDEIDAKSCKNVNLDNSVLIHIKFTKYLYAMLMHSKLMTTVKTLRNYASDKRAKTGAKIACGFQIIMSKSTSDIFNSKRYHTYIENLKINGYFKDNLEGSQEYNKLLESAKDYYSNTECPISSVVCQEIRQTMSSPEFLVARERLCHQTQQDNDEDQDDWLNVHPDQLNNFLNTSYGKKEKNNENSQTVTSKLSNFLKETSNFEGIEINDNLENENEIEFDTNEFVDTIQKMLKLISSDQENDKVNESSEDDICYDSDDTADTDDKSKTVVENLIQSMKEEEGSTGPSSNLLSSVGINKNDLLDSDDD